MYISTMKRFRQFLPVVISDFELSLWHHPIHTHNHYEIIYIKNGAGNHHINKEVIAYQKGSIFLLGPEEEHYFEIQEPTRFIFLKFTDLYLRSDDKGHDNWVQEMEYLLRNREVRLTGFQLTPQDQEIIEQLYNLIISLKQASGSNERLIWLQVMTLSAILKRNLPEFTTYTDSHKAMEAVFSYIHDHIYTPDQLKSVVMASHFNTTSSYMGPYFKRNAGLTLRDYIRGYRKTLIKKRLDSGHYSLKQIAAEFGLTDESHVSKLLK